MATQQSMKLILTIVIGLVVVIVIASVLIALGYVQIGQGGWAVGLLSTLAQIFNILGV